MEIRVTDYGASLVSLMVPDRSGGFRDVVLGFDSVAGYERQFQCVGGVIGRTCNRLEYARFYLNGKKYEVTRNFGIHNIHGGREGFHQKIWTYSPLSNGMKFTYFSKDGEEGYPGNLKISIQYIIEGETLKLQYEGETDADTLCNITSHSYFNLRGCSSGSAKAQWIKIYGDFFAEADKGGFPDGKLLPVEGTPMDFRKPKQMGKDLESTYLQIRWFGGYDSNYAIRGYDGSKMPKPAAWAWDEESGIFMKVKTTMPGMQFYTGNSLDHAPKGKNDSGMRNYDGYCFETQYFPNAMAHDNFVQPILRQGEPYCHITTFEFAISESLPETE